MSKKYYGLTFGRLDFQFIENMVKECCPKPVITVDGIKTDSLFNPNIHDKVKSPEEIKFTSTSPRFELTMNEQAIEIDHSDYDPVSRGLFECCQDRILNKQNFFERMFRTYKNIFFRFDTFPPIIGLTSMLVHSKRIDFYDQLVMLGTLVFIPCLFWILGKPFSRNKMSIVSNYPKSKPLSSMAVTIVGGIIVAVFAFILTQIDISKLTAALSH